MRAVEAGTSHEKQGELQDTSLQAESLLVWARQVSVDQVKEAVHKRASLEVDSR